LLTVLEAGPSWHQRLQLMSTPRPSDRDGEHSSEQSAARDDYDEALRLLSDLDSEIHKLRRAAGADMRAAIRQLEAALVEIRRELQT
jgi:hypothetical protein